MLLSYFIGQKKNPVPYPVATILGYFALALLLFAATQLIHPNSLALRLAINTLLLFVYVAVVLYNERALFRPILKKLRIKN